MKEVKFLSLIFLGFLVLLCLVWVILVPLKAPLAYNLISGILGVLLTVGSAGIVLYYRKKKYWEPYARIIGRDLLSCLRFSVIQMDSLLCNKAAQRQDASESTAKTEECLCEIEKNYQEKIKTFSFPEQFNEIESCFLACSNIFKEKLLHPYQSYLSPLMLMHIEKLREKYLLVSIYSKAMLTAHSQTGVTSLGRIESFKKHLEGNIKEILLTIKTLNSLARDSDSIVRMSI